MGGAPRSESEARGELNSYFGQSGDCMGAYYGERGRYKRGGKKRSSQCHGRRRDERSEGVSEFSGH